MTSRPNKCPRLTDAQQTELEVSNRPATPSITRVVRIGSRKSILALIQANHVLNLLKQAYADSGTSSIHFEFELVTMTTQGDQILDKPLAQIGSKALFTKELEKALLDQDIDLIVHSCKDLPTTLPDGLRVAAILSRENANDAFVLKKEGKIKFTNEKEFLEQLQQDKERDWTIGTSSLRRIAQLKHLAPNVKVADIRGNIDTRLKKLDDPNSNYAALILAAAGLKRAGFGDRINVSLRDNWWHAVGQGALALECRENDEFIHNLLYPLIHFKTTYEIIAERSFMQYLEGGCSVPLGVKCWFGTTDKQATTYFNLTQKSNDDQPEVTKCPITNAQGQCPMRSHGKRTLSQSGDDDQTADQQQEQQQASKKQLLDDGCVDRVAEAEQTNDHQQATKPQTTDNEGQSASMCPVLSAKRVMEHLLEHDRSITQEEYESSDHFDCNNISNLCLSGVVYSPDGRRRVQFNASLADAVHHFDQQSESQLALNCSHVALPTRACPKLQQVQVDYQNCAKLGVYVGKKMIEMGAQDILDELRHMRTPVSDQSEGSD